jgi:hypothetical protein
MKFTGFIDTRVYNFTVYDDTGSVLVAMTGFELKRNSTSSLPGIRTPVRGCLATYRDFHRSPPMPGPLVKAKQGDTDLIMTIADHEAQLLLRRSLDRGVTVGDDLDRQRYYQFAKDAITRHLPPLPPLPSVVEDIKAKWPIHFQIVRSVKPCPS